MKVDIKRDSRLGLYKLFYTKEGDKYIIGRDSTEVYIEVPEYGAEAIRELSKHKKIRDVEDYIKKSYGDYDIRKFAKKLLEIGFVKYVDGVRINDKYEKVKASLQFIKKKHINWLFSPIAYFIYFIIIIYAVYILFKNPVYFPNYRDFFFHNSLVVIMILSFVISWLLVLKHELAHYFAAISRGVKSRFSISNRLYYVVAETDITNLYHIPVKDRWRVYFAGMFSDYLFAAIAIILLYFSDLHIINITSFVYNILRFVVLIEVLSMLWQFMFFMKTDIYFALENMLKSESLLDDTLNYLKRILYKTLNMRYESLKKLLIPKEQLNIIRVYAVFVIVGVSVSFFRLFIFQVPIIIGLVKEAFQKITNSAFLSAQFFDGAVFLIIFSFDYIILFYSIYKNHRKISKNPILSALYHLINREKDIIIHSQHNSHSIQSNISTFFESTSRFRKELLSSKIKFDINDRKQ